MSSPLIDDDAGVHDDPPVQLAAILPEGFNLRALLTFLPDVKLKHDLAALVTAATSLDLQQPGGLQMAETYLAEIRARVKFITECFEEPTRLAHQLHTRLTGLRADFIASGVLADRDLARKILAETRRLDAVAAAQQATADAAARAVATEIADAALASGQPAEIVEELVQQATTVTAPPVARPTLTKTTAAKNWKARIAGSEEAQPKMAELTKEQAVGIVQLMRAVVEGHQPLELFEIAWPRLNDLAKAQQSRMRVPGIEAYDAGSLRKRR